MSADKILLLDAGNSRIKWAWLTQEGLRNRDSAPHSAGDFSARIEAAWAHAGRPLRVLIANVAGEGFASDLTAWIEKLWGLKPEFVVPQQVAFGVTNAYHDPGKLGSDRWAALIGVHHQELGPTCIVDCGTALTVDALTADGRHLGGLILPGLTMMRHALVSNTQGISYKMSDEAALMPFARCTGDGVVSGTLYALVAAIDRVVSDMTLLLEPETRVLTGGDAERLLPLLAGHYRHEPDLVLQGLAVIAAGGGQ